MHKKDIMNSPSDKLLIPAYKIYLYAKLPPSGSYRI